MNPVQNLPPYFSKIYYNIIFPSMSRSSTLSLPFRFPDNFLCISHFSYACYKLRPSHLPLSGHPKSIWWSTNDDDDDDKRKLILIYSSSMLFYHDCILFCVKWIHLTQERATWWSLENTVLTFGSHKRLWTVWPGLAERQLIPHDLLHSMEFFIFYSPIHNH